MASEAELKAREKHELGPVSLVIDSWRASCTCRCGQRFVSYNVSSIIAGEHVFRKAHAHMVTAGTGHFLVAGDNHLGHQGRYKVVSS